MKLLDWTLPLPEQNLAADEALLEGCEARDGEEVLRFWDVSTISESRIRTTTQQSSLVGRVCPSAPSKCGWAAARWDRRALPGGSWKANRHFVVVGYANDVAREVNVAACAARGVPILRRCSGGGTVLQGPGCLNYAVILRIDAQGPTRSISATNQFVMERNRAAIESLLLASDSQREAVLIPHSVLRTPHSAIQVQGHTDLTLNGMKFSGNAQRRKRRCLLFHGTILLGLDLALVEEVLPLPSRQPEYRQGRAHRQFLCHLPLAAAAVKQALRAAWDADEPLSDPPTAAVEALVREKYGRRDWNLRVAGSRMVRGAAATAE